MSRTAALPPERKRGGGAGPAEALSCAGGALCWLALSPLVALHEAAHAAAAAALGFEVHGAGVVVEHRGDWAVPLYKVVGAFVVREPGGGGPADAAVSFAPALWALPAAALWLSGHAAAGALLGAVAATVMSDVYTWFSDPLAGARYVVLLGSVPQRQASLADFR
jgi:hypothetical protein